MLLKRTLAIGLGCVGGLCLLAAVETPAAAVTCVPQSYSPYECEHAHEESNLDNPGNVGCLHQNGVCVPGPGSRCGGNLGWGVVIPGRCKIQEDLSGDPLDCTLEYGITVVTLHQWRGDCLSKAEGGCECVIYPDYENPNSENVQVCDCRHDAY